MERNDARWSRTVAWNNIMERIDEKRRCMTVAWSNIMERMDAEK